MGWVKCQKCKHVTSEDRGEYSKERGFICDHCTLRSQRQQIIGLKKEIARLKGQRHYSSDGRYTACGTTPGLQGSSNDERDVGCDLCLKRINEAENETE